MAGLRRHLDALERQLSAIQKQLPGAQTSGDGVFVVGCPRSGTSALAWAIAAHRAFWTGPESNFLYTLAAQGLPEAYARGAARENGWMRSNEVGFDEFAAAIGEGVHGLFASRARGARWVDSSTENTLVLDTLAKMFPAVKFVHVIRDGRAVVASLMDSGFGQPWTGDFAIACQTWVDFVTAGMVFRQAHPQRMLEVRNESMAEEAERIVAFLGEESPLPVSRFLKSRRINSSFGRDGKMRARKEAWRDWPQAQAQVFEEIAGPTLRHLGYAGDAE